MSTLTSYAQIWLAAHLNRTEEWLRERFADGFDIHHMDEDRANKDPLNLVLIENTDHMRLHGLFMLKPCRNHEHRSKNGKKGGAASRKNLSAAQATKLGRKAALIRHSGGPASIRSYNARAAALARWAKCRLKRDS